MEKYEISIDRVVEIFHSLAGRENAADGRVFCRSAADMLERWIAGPVEPCRDDYLICYAAACTAYYRFVLKSSGDAMDIKAGDVTVNDCTEQSVEYAKRLMDDALESISHLLKSKRFAFRRTGV